jgi:uncharacterized membrane protein
MRKFQVAIFILSAIFLLQNCAKDTTTSSNTPKVAFTYAPVKAYFDSKCADCHASGKSNASNWLYDPSDYDGSIKSYGSAIHNDIVVKQSMPPSGSTTSEKNNITTWKNANYPATN